MKIKITFKNKFINFINNCILMGRYLLSPRGKNRGHAFFICGAESSGNRMITRYFLGSGCSGDDVNQIYNYENPPLNAKNIVWKNSIPEGRKIPNLILMIKLIRKLGYAPHIIWVKREMFAVIKSQIRHGYVKNEKDSIKRINFAYKLIKKTKLIANVPCEIISYERFTTNLDYRKKIAQKYNLKHKELEKYENKNKKYEINS